MSKTQDRNWERLRSIKTIEELLAYLREELDWPLEGADVEDVAFEYTPEELGLEPALAVKIDSIHRLRPLSTHQPWGIFFVDFEPKNLPVTALRRILGRVVLKKRAKGSAQAWHADDLLFISTYGQGPSRQICLAHFSASEGARDLPTLKVLGWDEQDTALHLAHAANTLVKHLTWPENENDLEIWRKTWSAAFTLGHREVISTAKDLSIRLAALARAIRLRITTALAIESESGPLTRLMHAFREALVHDLTVESFADMYAQTIAYGLLSARITDPHKKTADDFAGHLRTNPFLRELMETFLKVGGRQGKAGGSGIDFDELGVFDVVELLDDANMEAVVRDFGDRNPQEDPVIHFYEEFLRHYDPGEKKKRGVFYTPRPVVSYIVRSVDELLRTEFGLEDGLADTTTWGEMLQRQPGLQLPNLSEDSDHPRLLDPQHPFVQILDPATGTGTFLVEVIEIIHRTMTTKWTAHGHSEKQIEALWNAYVPRHLLPRLHGYELLMAPYAIAHLKIGLKLHETGYHFDSEERARIYLTNALEPANDKQITTAMLPALAHEAQAVSMIKRHQRFSVIIGNPPYARDSANRSDYAENLVAIYKEDVRNERNIQPLSDDYVKFIGMAQAVMSSCGTGIVGFITNHSFIKGVIHRGLRRRVCQFFQRAYFLDLHGNSNINEQPPKDIEDENVFDIRQGVAVSLLTRVSAVVGYKDQTKVSELWGKRTEKYEYLLKQRHGDNDWILVEPKPPEYELIVAGDGSTQVEFDSLFHLHDWFPTSATGFITHRDELVIDYDQSNLMRRIHDLVDKNISDEEVIKKYSLESNSDWNPIDARKQLRAVKELQERVVRCTYRPFDSRWCWWGRELMDRPRQELFEFFVKPNLTLLCKRQNKRTPFSYAFVASEITESCTFESAHANNVAFPIFVHTNDLLFGKNIIHPNIGDEIVSRVRRRLNLNLVSLAMGDLKVTCGPRDLLHYVYATIHAPSYRTRYEACLIKSFPRIPLTYNLDLFRDLTLFGGRLVALHLLESPTLDHFITTYAGPPQPEVGRVGWSDGTVWLDAAATKKGQPATPGRMGFKGVPEEVWNFHIGGYQVCEKWLKDRKGRRLSDEDIAHYQKIVVALKETIRLMGEIDEVIEKHGGWPGAFAAGPAAGAADYPTCETGQRKAAETGDLFGQNAES
ncbi:MAG: type ISP restriction/modification enzyme [Candidatus Delongbacteria bacterium]